MNIQILLTLGTYYMYNTYAKSLNQIHCLNVLNLRENINFFPKLNVHSYISTATDKMTSPCV